MISLCEISFFNIIYAYSFLCSPFILKCLPFASFHPHCIIVDNMDKESYISIYRLNAQIDSTATHIYSHNNFKLLLEFIYRKQKYNIILKEKSFTHTIYIYNVYYTVENPGADTKTFLHLGCVWCGVYLGPNQGALILHEPPALIQTGDCVVNRVCVCVCVLYKQKCGGGGG